MDVMDVMGVSRLERDAQIWVDIPLLGQVVLKESSRDKCRQPNVVLHGHWQVAEKDGWTAFQARNLGEEEIFTSAFERH